MTYPKHPVAPRAYCVSDKTQKRVMLLWRTIDGNPGLLITPYLISIELGSFGRRIERVAENQWADGPLKLWTQRIFDFQTNNLIEDDRFFHISKIQLEYLV